MNNNLPSSSNLLAKIARPLMGIFCALQILFLTGCLAVPQKKDIAPKGEVPKVKKDCSLCHGTHDAKQGPILLVRPIETLCITCHADRKTPNEHKVDIVPSMKVKTLPLTNGKLTCITCHDPHQNLNEHMLRKPRKELCIQCHQK